MNEAKFLRAASRRAVLCAATGAVALAGAASAGAAEEAGPDAELLRLLAEMAAIKHEADGLSDQASHVQFADPKHARLQARAAEIMRGWEDRRRRVVLIPARTRAGLQAKARAALDLVNLNEDGSPIDDEAMYWSVLKDVLAGAPG
jgi:hypothetical protein